MPARSRREFIHRSLQAGTVAIAAPMAASLVSSARAQNNQRLGFALVGLGGLSTNQIAPALQKTKNCRLAGIVTGTPAKEQIWADK